MLLIGGLLRTIHKGLTSTTQNGTKLIKFHISGNDWLDPTTFRIMFDLINTDAAAKHNLRSV